MYDLTFTEITGGEPHPMMEEPGVHYYRAWEAQIPDTDFFALIIVTFSAREREQDIIRVTEYVVSVESQNWRTTAKYRPIKQDHVWEPLPQRQGGTRQACAEFVLDQQPWPGAAHRMIDEVLEENTTRT